jgi:hypothetical protein
MKRIVFATAIAILAAAGVAGVPEVASSKESGTSLTLSARDYYYGRHRHHYRGWRSHYAGCRVVVRSHINRWGHRVFVRKRICY